MSFLKNILKPFVEFEEGKPESSTVRKPAITPKAAISETEATEEKAIAASVLSNTSGSKSNGSVTSLEYEKYFEKLIDEANRSNQLFQGTDFKEFIDSKADVEAITDEATRYRTAFNVLKRTGLTKDRLLTTGQEYVKIVENDMKGFEAAFQQQYKTEVEQKEQILQKKAEELQALNQRIAAINAEMKKTSQEAVQAKERLTSNRKLFLDAGESKKQEIVDELEKIQQYF